MHIFWENCIILTAQLDSMRISLLAVLVLILIPSAQGAIYNCVSYISPTLCGVCLSGFVTINGNTICQKQIPNCIQWDSTNSYCIQCSNLTVLSPDNSVCYSPISKCITYNYDYSACQTCAGGYFVDAGGVECYRVVGNCLSYVGGSCSVCNDGYSVEANGLACGQNPTTSKTWLIVGLVVGIVTGIGVIVAVYYLKRYLGGKWSKEQNQIDQINREINSREIPSWVQVKRKSDTVLVPSSIQQNLSKEQQTMMNLEVQEENRPKIEFITQKQHKYVDGFVNVKKKITIKSEISQFAKVVSMDRIQIVLEQENNQ